MHLKKPNPQPMKSWKFKLIFALTLVILCFSLVKIYTTWLDDDPKPTSKHDEAYYITKLAKQLSGDEEVKIEGGRIDILTDDHAIEVEWAGKWKDAIGQSLWYALQKNSKPRIILLLKNDKEYIHFVRLNSALEYAKIIIETNYIELHKIKDEEADLIIE
jgi:hypothetical protein